jgi:hypothetical protein
MAKRKKSKIVGGHKAKWNTKKIKAGVKKARGTKKGWLRT